MVAVYSFLLLFSIFHNVVIGYKNPNCANGHSAVVHLFEWKWNDIAAECERFLGPRKFCGVQISPPNEHTLIVSPDYNQKLKYPWYQRYQPVSYQLVSRSGNEEEFINMVETCNRNGVRIYADAIINHMAADLSTMRGSAGNVYNPKTLSYPGVPFGPNDFNSCDQCPHSCNIQNYQDAKEVRNCRLVGLPDLNQGSDYTRATLVKYLNRLVEMGVAGFRVDACKHMWPADIKQIFDRVNNLRRDVFGDGARPFVAQEVIDLGAEPIKSSEYVAGGRVTEFHHCMYLGQTFQGKNQLRNLHSWGTPWGMLPSQDAFVFVDNHDNQRGHGPGGRDVISFYMGNKYLRAVAFMLSYGYGFPRIMSSYRWPGGPYSNDWIGPPSDENGNTHSVQLNDDGSCKGDWVCEHRWNAIRNLPAWRAVAEFEPVRNWWDNGNNQIAFSRGNRAFIAINNEGYMLSANLQTGLPAGDYCDVGRNDFNNGACSGATVRVGGDGRANVQLGGGEDDIGVLAIHVGARTSGGGNPPRTTKTTRRPPTKGPTIRPPAGWKRTVVFLQKSTQVGQDVFLRGGLNFGEPCSQAHCGIPILYNEYSGPHFNGYNAWRMNDKQLDWNGAELNQGWYVGKKPEGSPSVWTTSDQHNPDAHVPDNRYGDHYWMWDVMMDCSKTRNGWFEVKGYLSDWEGNVVQGTCQGRQLGHGFASNNHVGVCGKVNVFVWGKNSCLIAD